jgi:hypothetical protein
MRLLTVFAAIDSSGSLSTDHRVNRSANAGNPGNAPCGSAWYQYAVLAMSSVSG